MDTIEVHKQERKDCWAEILVTGKGEVQHGGTIDTVDAASCQGLSLYYYFWAVGFTGA